MCGPFHKEAALRVLINLEFLLLVAAVFWVWRRSRSGEARHGRLHLALAAVALAQAAVLIGLRILSEWRYPVPGQPAEGLASFAGFILLGQILRAGLLAAGLLAWLRLIRKDLTRKWVWIPLALGTALMLTGNPGLSVPGGFLAFFAMTRMRWADRVVGWRRALALLVSPVLLMMFMFNFGVLVTGTAIDTGQINVSDAPSVNLLVGDLTGTALTLDRLVRPVEALVRILCDLLRLHFLVAALKFLVLPVHLRGLSLRKRFAVTTALYRLVPGTLGLIAVVLGVYFGLGLHKSAIVRTAFNETVSSSVRVAERLVADPAVVPPGGSGTARARAMLDAMRPWLGPDGHGAHFVLRRIAFSEPDSAGVTSPRNLAEVATAGTPKDLRDLIPFPSADSTSRGGLVVADTTFYLAAAAGRQVSGGAILAEVYVPVDSLYLARVAHRAGVDLRLQANPRVHISRQAIIMSDRNDGNDRTWTAKRFELRAGAGADTARAGFWWEPHYMARSFIPVGDWQDVSAEERRGAVLLTLSTSPHALIQGIFNQPYFLPSNMFASLALIIIVFLFGIAEISAARTGSSIIKGILDDVRSLTRAAKRIGEGDLDHRIEIRDKDELGSLAATFNDMSANLKRHQQDLLEKERLEADLALARDIQQRLLPQESPRIGGLDVAGVSLPSREVGGDLFYFLPQDGRLGVAIGDVSGKSVPAALLMSNVLAALRAETRFPVPPHEILAHINDLIAQQVETGKFVTFIYGVVDPARDVFDYASAGHNPPLKVTAAGEGEWLPVSGIALGILPGSEYTAASASLRPGDVLVLYSDGVTEAERSPVEELMAAASGKGGGPAGTAGAAESGPMPENGGSDENLEFFEEERLLATVRAARAGSASEIVEAVLNAVSGFTGDSPQSDDLTLVVVKMRGEA